MEYDRPDELEISPMAVALAQAVAEEEELEQPNRFDTYYIDSEEVLLENRPSKLIAEESIMSNKKRKSLLILYNKFDIFV